tara:strand:+ start:855 stop:1454 length:600 start_codon:yes stop_codon:yes gene_type:complete
MKKKLAGVDEVGRGSLIGPVYAAAVIFKVNINKKKLNDSKKLSKKKRELLEKYIKRNSYWSIGSASLKEIERLNILNASLLAMKRAIKKLKVKPKKILIDGNKIPKMKNYNLKFVIKGDQKIPEISAASIIAKVSRDRLMKKMSKNNIDYSWDKNAGYGTKDHLSAIKKLGVTKHHRKKFRPIYNILSLKKTTPQIDSK